MAGFVALAGEGICTACLQGSSQSRDVKRQAKSRDIPVCKQDAPRGGRRERLMNHVGERKD